MGVHVVSSADLGSGSDGGGQVIPEPVQKKTWASVVTSNQKASVKLSGFIGIVECAFIYEPLTDNEFDKEAASRALAFDLACFMQLDLGQLQVRNEFSWHGCPEKDPSVVHLDVLDTEILGINMTVGINGCIGKSMIRDGQGINVYVRHSLRDVFWKVPTFSLGVKTRNAIGLVAPAIVAGLGALTYTLDTLVLVIGASGFATAAATTTIGTVVGSFR
ncbi:hypothetical protein CsSME_00006650 [Camellia sinensis var. sinensis]